MITYYTYKKDVPLQPGQTLAFATGKGYYAAGAGVPRTPEPPSAPPQAGGRRVDTTTMTDAVPASGAGQHTESDGSVNQATIQPTAVGVTKPGGLIPVPVARVYYTYKDDVPLKPDETLSFAAGRGYYARPAEPKAARVHLRQPSAALAPPSEARPSHRETRTAVVARYYTYKSDVPVASGQVVRYMPRRGYYAANPITTVANVQARHHARNRNDSSPTPPVAPRRTAVTHVGSASARRTPRLSASRQSAGAERISSTASRDLRKRTASNGTTISSASTQGERKGFTFFFLSTLARPWHFAIGMSAVVTHRSGSDKFEIEINTSWQTLALRPEMTVVGQIEIMTSDGVWHTFRPYRLVGGEIGPSRAFEGQINDYFTTKSPRINVTAVRYTFGLLDESQDPNAPVIDREPGYSFADGLRVTRSLTLFVSGPLAGQTRTHM